MGGVGRALSGLSGRLTDYQQEKEARRRQALFDQLAIMQAQQQQEQMLFQRKMAESQEQRSQEQFTANMADRDYTRSERNLSAYQPDAFIPQSEVDTARKAGVPVDAYTKFGTQVGPTQGSMSMPTGTPIGGHIEAPELPMQTYTRAGTARRELPEERLRRLQEEKARLDIAQATKQEDPATARTRDHEVRMAELNKQFENQKAIAQIYAAAQAPRAGREGVSPDRFIAEWTTTYTRILTENYKLLEATIADGGEVAPEDYQRAMETAVAGADAAMKRFEGPSTKQPDSVGNPGGPSYTPEELKHVPNLLALYTQYGGNFDEIANVIERSPFSDADKDVIFDALVKLRQSMQTLQGGR